LTLFRPSRPDFIETNKSPNNAPG